MKKSLNIENTLNPDSVATRIANYWQEWQTYRGPWMAERRELRNYLFATDTRTTTNKTLPWANTTTTPKLTQIYDNLKANYSAALFPNDGWLEWEPGDNASSSKQKAGAVEAYMKYKWRQSGARKTFDQCLDDYIQTGMCFATTEWVEEYKDLETGERVPGYIGPRMVRISPYDISFNPTAARWEDTPKIIRSIIDLGEAKQLIEQGQEEYRHVFERIMGNRREVVGSTSVEKADGYIADGFSSIENYYSSGAVEILTFYGNLYDATTGEVKSDRIIKIIDRAYVISDESIPTWLVDAPIYKASWRDRPDSLYAMGPLDNLVGMQYRIDHLENLKADVFDFIAYPMTLIQGSVEEFEHKPGEMIFLGEEGSVAHLRPDATALNADFQISALENKMEEMAGAPRQAMGIRTPGEKTAFEVQTLQNSLSRIFEHKAMKLEMEFTEPLLNGMLEQALRNMVQTDLIRVFGDDGNFQYFKEVTKEDIAGRGKLRPKGARHFSEKALRVQNLNNMIGIRLNDPSIGVHLSGKEIARILAEEIGEESIYSPNVGVTEQTETQMAAQDAEVDMQEEMQIKAEAGL